MLHTQVYFVRQRGKGYGKDDVKMKVRTIGQPKGKIETIQMLFLLLFVLVSYFILSGAILNERMSMQSTNGFRFTN